MCRIAIVPPKTFSADELSEIFLGLEISNGGDGNGVYPFDTQKPEHDLTHVEAAKRLASAGGVFHTRLASVGGTSKEHLHPVEAGKGYLVQNGTWSNWYLYESSARHDTTVIGELVEKAGRDALAASDLASAGVLVYMEGRHVYIYKRSNRPFGVHYWGKNRYMLVSEDVSPYIEGHPGGFFPLPDDTFIKLSADDFTPRVFEPNPPSLHKYRSYTYLYQQQSWSAEYDVDSEKIGRSAYKNATKLAKDADLIDYLEPNKSGNLIVRGVKQ